MSDNSGYTDPLGGVDWNETQRPSRRRREGPHLRSVGPEERDRTPDWLRDSGGSYDPQKFYIRSTDSRGHQYQIKTINVPQGYSEPLASIREYFPEYRTNADIVRDALVHMMMLRLHQMEDGVHTAFMKIELNTARMAYLKAYMEMAKGEVEAFEETLKMALENRDWAQMEKALDTLEETLNEDEMMQEEAKGMNPYRERLKEVQRVFSGEMKRVRERGEWK